MTAPKRPILLAVASAALLALLLAIAALWAIYALGLGDDIARYFRAMLGLRPALTFLSK